MAMMGKRLEPTAASEEGGGHGDGREALTRAPGAVDGYLRLPYTVRVTADPTGGYVASVEELPGCVTQGESWAEVGEMVRDAMRAWITAALEDGRPVPVPREDAEPARVLVRLPRSLHRALVRAAQEEGVSLNQFIVYRLAQATAARGCGDGGGR